MTARVWSRKRFALLLSVLLVTVPVAFAAKAANGPVEMHFACAKKSNGQLRYVAAADECRKKERLIRFRETEPLIACAYMSGHGRVYVYAMGSRAKCRNKKRPSFVLVLPDTTRHWFCANERNGKLRSARLVPSAPVRTRVFTNACKRNEMRVFVERDLGAPDVNDAPRAVADAGSTNEDTATTIAVLANDTDPDPGDALTVTNVDTTGTAGAVTIGAGGALRYDPAGRLDGLRAGEQRIDRFVYTVSDGHGGSAGAIVSVTVTGVNDAPVVTTSGGSAAYTENAAAVPVDGGLTVTDADDASLEGAQVRISAGFESGDDLRFTDQLGITGSYDAGSGVLMLSGSSSLANYQTALRSIEFRNLGDDDPAAVKTIEFRAADGGGLGPAATRAVAVTGVDDPPAITTSAGAVGYTEGDPATPVDPGLALSDPDSAQISGASVQITGNHTSPEDVLALPLQPNIAGAYNSATGTLTLTGTDTVANYQAALRAVTYRNTSSNPSTAQRTLTFVASDGSSSSSPATRNVNVSPTDNAPDVDNSAGALAYTENDPATAIDTTITITDPDSANLTGATVQITGNYVDGQDVLALPAQPVVTASFDAPSGVLTLSGTASIAAYESALEAVTYVNTSDNPSTATRTVTYAARDAGGFGSPDTHGITIAAVDDPPVAVDDSATVAEDSSAGAVDVLANDTDVDGGPKTIASATDPANGTVVITGGGTGLTYQPDPNYCNSPPGTTPDTFDYTLNGGDTATVSVTVTCLDDAPTAVDDSATVGEDSGASAIDVLANDTDIDGGPKSVASATDPANGTVVITGGGTGLTYQPDPNYCNSPPGTTPDTFDYTLNGGDTATVSVTVTCSDDSPIAVNDSATVLEDSSATAIDTLANDTDPDGGTKSIQSVTQPANGTVVITGGGTGLTYQPDPNYCNDPPGTTPDTFTYSLNGGSTATVSVTVTCVPDAPTIDNSPGNTSYTENGPATAIDPAVTVTDPDSGATIAEATVQISGGFAEDILALSGSHPGITPSVSGDTLTLTGPASVAAFQAALRDVTYRNSSDNPSTAPRTVTFTVDDGASPTASDTKGITVVAVDDPPTAVNDGATVLEDAAATAIDALANDTDPDGGPKSIQSVTQPANGTVVITGGGTGLTYQPDPNYCNDPPGTTPDTFTYTLNGGSSATVSITVTCVNDAPVADDETFSGNDSAHGNTAMVVNDPDDGAPVVTHPKTTVSGDILAGDTDVDGPGPLTVTPGTFPTNDGGSVTIESDGDFTFHPAASTSCTDTSDFFDYTVEDSGTPEEDDTGRVTIAIAGCVWYVNNDAAGNSGTSAEPFDTLSQAETASGNNHTVFVFDGNDTSSGLGGDGYAMNAGERLIGEHEGLVVDPDQGGGLTPDTLHPASPGALPTLTATNADVIALDDGNEVRAFDVDPEGAGGGIAGGAGDTGGGTIDDVNVVDAGITGSQAGLELNGTAGTFTITNLVVGNSATGVLLANAGTTDFGSTTITSSGAPGLSATGTDMSTSQFDLIVSSNSSNGGVNLDGTTGTTTLGDGIGNDLSLTTTSGSQPAFRLSNAGTVTVGTAGTDNVSATGGPAVDVTGTTGAALAFDAVSSTNSTGDGINLAGLGTGTFSAASGTIGGAAGIAFDLDGGSGAVSYPGDLNNGAGQAAEITGRNGGAVTLSGPIADTGDAGGGIIVNGNTGGSTTFSNASKVLNTTTSNAVSFTSSDGHTLDLSNGGLDIDTTTGQGVFATSSGTLTVRGSGNTVSTGSGRAVNVQSTDFGSLGFTFQSVSSNGAPNGILLNSTGTSAGMTITGTGAANSGGSIQNATEHGVSLTTTNNFNADELSITGANFAGVDGTDVTNFTFTDGEIVNAGDTHTDNLHGAIAFNDQAGNENNVDGTLVITGNLLKDHHGGGVDVFNRNGTISDATVSNNTIDSPADEALSREDAISFNLFGSASTVASLTKAQIEDNVITDHPSGNGITFLGAQTNTGGAPVGMVGQFGSATNRILIDGNLLTGDPTLRFGGAAILAGVEGRGQGNFDITNNGTALNPITNVGTHGIATGNSGSSSVEYLIQNNRVNANNFEGGGLGIRSASDQHIMADLSVLATPTLRTIIDGNHVRNTTGGGVRVLAGNSNGTSELKVTNNDIANGAAGTSGISIENGATTGAPFTAAMCATISANTVAANAPSGGGNTFPGILLAKRVGSFGVPGLSPSPSSNANTESFLTGLNPNANLGGGFFAGKRVAVNVGDNFVSCTHPAGF